MQIVEQLGRGITQYMGVARIDLRLVRKPVTYGKLCIYRDLTRQIKNFGIPIVGEYKGQISRDRYVTRAEMNVEIQGLEERFRAPTEEERELEEESSPAFTPTPQRHRLYGGSQVAEVFEAPPNLDLMFSYELDEQAVPDYYVEEYTVPVKRKHKWQGNVDAGINYYRKLNGRAHPLLKEFEEYISEELKGELYCVARAVVEHKGVEESIEKDEDF
ncbi:unnamed protein product [Cylicocyclus nassatus]|uniref:Uncharacterized protein n=1 Tax=Cylicocyclus nassatus TaxID=53992 RepID=A0AA36GLT0_CYLNA|nr:unnamed protein product [Cylicocyclus nassatus]